MTEESNPKRKPPPRPRRPGRSRVVGASCHPGWSSSRSQRTTLPLLRRGGHRARIRRCRGHDAADRRAGRGRRGRRCACAAERHDGGRARRGSSWGCSPADDAGPHRTGLGGCAACVVVRRRDAAMGVAGRSAASGHASVPGADHGVRSWTPGHRHRGRPRRRGPRSRRGDRLLRRCGRGSPGREHPARGRLRVLRRAGRPLVAAGDAVVAGQVIGTLAASPRHAPDGGLHLGARLHGDYVDPALLLAALQHAVLLPLVP